MGEVISVFKENEKDYEESTLECDQCKENLGRVEDLYDNSNRPIEHYNLQTPSSMEALHFCNKGCMLKFYGK